MVENFKTNLHVDKRIVDLLSKSTYQKSFSSALRELVSNAYDADALSVNIEISSDYKKIFIEDDGNGMSKTEFYKYLTIAGKKNVTDLTRKYKRKRIGQFGVGFISIFPFCEFLEIVTTVENSDEVLSAKIPTFDYSNLTKDQYVDEIPILGKIIEDKSQRLKHYARISLIKPNYHVSQYFGKIDTRKRDSIITYKPFDRFLWELQEDLPLSYKPNSSSISKIKYEEPIGISVFVNKEPIYRNDLQGIVLEQGTQFFSEIECSYIFTTSYRSIKPLEARGIKRRVNNVGIGPRTDFELKRDRGFSRLHWISGEIHFSEKIKEHLTLSRDTFILNPVIDEINEYFAKKLRECANYVESVAVAEKEIELSIAGSTKGNVTPKDIIITENLKKLKDKGFKIVHKQFADTHEKKEPVKIDKTEKIVTVYDRPELKKDYIFVLNDNYEIIYKNEGFADGDSPCRLVDKNLIELNKNYPPFKSKTYGNLFKKLHILFIIAEKNSNSTKQMYDYIIKNFISEFDQYI